jgi:hypothetical protein
MARYIVLYHAPIGVVERLASATPEEAMAGVHQWVNWAQKLGPALIDPGRPLGNAISVKSSGSAATKTSVIGMSVLETESIEDALAMVQDHHHLQWADGCEILLLEEMPIPELEPVAS